MKNSHKKNGPSFVYITTGVFIIYSFIIFFLAIGIFKLTLDNYSDPVSKAGIAKLKTTYEKTPPEQYVDINEKKIIGSGSYIEIRDSEGGIVFTDREFGSVRKYSTIKINFEDSNGEDRIMIVAVPNNFASYIGRWYRGGFKGFMKFIAAYIVIMILFVWGIIKIIKTPLFKLDQAMNEISEGAEGTMIFYTGPEEFEHICEKFNDMSMELYKSRQQTREMYEKKRHMLANISHDLKTPVTVINGYAQALNDGLVPEDEMQRYFEVIMQKTKSIENILEDFKTYQVLNSSDDFYNMQSIDITEFTRRYFAECYGELEAKHRQLEINIDDEAFYVLLDKSKMRRIFDNLLVNFYKYAGENSTLFVEVICSENNVNIYIGDNGRGVPEGLSDMIFEAFVTEDVSRQESSGLGLAFIKDTVEHFGGSIKLAKVLPDKLSTQFIITLPKDA